MDDRLALNESIRAAEERLLRLRQTQWLLKGLMVALVVIIIIGTKLIWTPEKGSAIGILSASSILLSIVVLSRPIQRAMNEERSIIRRLAAMPGTEALPLLIDYARHQLVWGSGSSISPLRQGGLIVLKDQLVQREREPLDLPEKSLIQMAETIREIYKHSLFAYPDVERYVRLAVPRILSGRSMEAIDMVRAISNRSSWSPVQKRMIAALNGEGARRSLDR